MEWSKAEKLLVNDNKTFVPREQQQILANQISEAFGAGKNLVAQAPTGTGKTFAYLIPLIGREGRSLIATGTKVLQDQVKSDLQYLEQHLDTEFTWTVLKGRSNYLCEHRARNSGLGASGNSQLINKVIQAANRLQNGDRTVLPVIDDHLWSKICSESDYCSARKCSKRLQNPCWAEHARNVASQCDIVSINHHLLFTDQAFKIRMRSEDGFLPPYDYLVMDEAHRAADTARLCMGNTLTEKDLAGRLTKVIQGLEENGLDDVQEIHDLVNEVDTEINALFSDTAAKKSGQLNEARIESLVVAISSLSAQVQQVLTASGQDAGSVASTFLKGIEYDCSLLKRALTDDRLSAWWDTSGITPKLIIARVDIYGSLPGVPIAMMSATMFPKGNVGYHPQQFGLENYESIMLPTPFNLPRQIIGYATNRSSGPTEVPLEELVTLVKASRGRALVLFTNRLSMVRATEHLRATVPYPVLMQGDDTVDAIAKQFRRDVNSVLCATRSFFEGVNFPGETCSLVVLMALPFTHPDDPLHKARRRYLDNRNIRSFNALTLPECLTSFEQAVGRAIRTVDDRAAVAILDPRLASQSQRKRYGHDFAGTLKGVKWTYSASDVERFLREH